MLTAPPEAPASTPVGVVEIAVPAAMVKAALPRWLWAAEAWEWLIRAVKQPGAGRPHRRQGVDEGRLRDRKAFLARGFDKAAIAAQGAAAREDRTGEDRPVVGPDHDIAAIARSTGIGGNAGALGHIGEL